jgi:hypothetical protein
MRLMAQESHRLPIKMKDFSKAELTQRSGVDFKCQDEDVEECISVEDEIVSMYCSQQYIADPIL